MKEKKSRRDPANPDEVIAGRVRPDAPSLIALIREVNPTGRGLPPRQTKERYAQKSRLQSVLITRFQDEIDVHAHPNEAGVVSLRHLPSGLDACHALVAELDDAARSWVQYRLDIEMSERRAPSEPRTPVRVDAPAQGEPKSPVDEGELDVPALLEAGREAMAAYDYEAAQARFEAALERSTTGALEPAFALLSLLVDHLGADEEALALEGRIDAHALRDRDLRLLFAIAAARRGERARSLSFLNERGSLDSARAAEVFVALARAAIRAGLLDKAAEDLVRAKAQDPTHPELLSLSDALTKERAAFREPAEAELTRLFTAGEIDAAERAAEELLARFPDSEVGRRIARAVAEQRRREQAAQILASAREELAAGKATSALTLLRKALVAGLEGEEATWAEECIAALETDARAREEQARLEKVRSLLAEGQFNRGLLAYLALDAPGRRVVRELSGLRLLLWLEALAPLDVGARAKTAIPAVLALERATELLEREPRAALDTLEPHTKVLQGFAPAEALLQKAHLALAEQRIRDAQRAVEDAQRALFEGRPERVDEILRDASLSDLPEDERTAADELWAHARKLDRKRVLTGLIESLRREGDELRALSTLQELFGLSEEADKARLEALSAELRAQVQQKFCVEVEEFGGKGASSELWDTKISTSTVWRTLLSPSAPSGLEDHIFVHAETKGCGVFLRLIELPSATLRARVMLRTPVPLELVCAHLLGRHLVLVGQTGAVLEISLDTFDVVRWSPNVLRKDEGFKQTNAPWLEGLPSGPDGVVEEAVFALDGRSLWMNVLVSTKTTARRDLHVLAWEDLRPIREIHEPRDASVHVRPVFALRTPRMVITRGEEFGLRFVDMRGQPLGESLSKLPVEADAITACPDGERIFMILSDPDGPQDPETVKWGWVEVAGGVASPMRVLEGVTAIYHVAAVTSFEAGMCFALFEIKDKGCELFGFREGASGLELVYRTMLPRRSMLLGDPASRHAALLMEQGDRGERLEIIALGPEPPAPLEGPPLAFFSFPVLPIGAGSGRVIECHRPTGARHAAAIALANTMRRESEFARQRRLDTTRRRGSAEELLKLVAALLSLNESAKAGHVSAAAWHRFPRHPRVQLGEAHTIMNVKKWRDAHALLSRVDLGGLSESERKHLHHIQGINSMMLGELEAALTELERAEQCKEGKCELNELIALCTPLSDTARTWSPGQVRIREYRALIASADAALERGDASAARRSLDCLLVWEAYELQSMARLAEAYLREEEVGGMVEPFRLRFVLFSCCELFERKGSYRHREMPLSRVAWSVERISAVLERARARLSQGGA